MKNIVEEYSAHDILIENLKHLLEKGGAHVSLDEALEGIDKRLLGKKPHGLPYSIWQLAEHIRIAQADILEFSINKAYKEMDWPGDYWPKETEPIKAAQWNDCIEQIKTDRNSFIDLLMKSGDKLYVPFEHGSGQTLLKEALVLADHNSYHTGEIVIIRRLLNDWKKH